MIKSLCHSNVIGDHWNWSSNISYNSLGNFKIEVTKHGFTHVDAPSHMIRNGKSLSDCDLDLLCGWAKIIDVSECIGDKPITSQILENKIKNVTSGDIVILKSNLNEIYPNTSSEYWKNSPYLDDSGSNLLISKRIKSIIFDFPQDRAAKDLQHRVVMNKEFTEHQIVLGAGVMHVEHVIKLEMIEDNEVFIFALPIKLPNADGGNCTPISIQGLDKKEYSIVDHSKNMINSILFKSYLTLSFDKGDQVQETGFLLSGFAHTMFVASDSKNYEDMFNRLVVDKFEIVKNFSEIKDEDKEVLIINNSKIDFKLLIQKIKNIKVDILCLPNQPNLLEINELHKYVSKIFINLENLNKIKSDSKIIFGLLKIAKSNIAPARIVSIS